MEYNLLIHSMSLFSPITLPLLEAINATLIAEIGAEHGGNSKFLFEYLKQRNGKLISIDCCPSEAFLNWLPSVQEVVQHIPKESLHAIADVNNVDAWFIDGDHNWYTVYHELMMIREQTKKQNKPTLIFLHDVGWPWARRDLYYAPDRIPLDYRHPHGFKQGVTLDNPGVIDGGFRSDGSYAVALQEGGSRNGVMTAIEDFRDTFPNEYCFAHIPGVFGLGVLFDLTHPQAEKIAMLVMPFHNNAFMQALETNRLANYLKVIELQDRESAQGEPAPLEPKLLELEEPSPMENITSWEGRAVSLLNLLDNEGDQPSIWGRLTAQLPDTRDALKQFINYLGMLLAVPQDTTTIKLISVIEAISLAKMGDLKLAHGRLEQLYSAYPDCSLILGAYQTTLNVIL